MSGHSPSVMDSVGVMEAQTACLSCGGPLTGRRADARFCSQACAQRAYRLRHQPSVPVPKRLPVHRKVYVCPDCETRYLGEQRCEACGTFCRLLGPGGECPSCCEPVTLDDLGLT